MLKELLRTTQDIVMVLERIASALEAGCDKPTRLAGYDVALLIDAGLSQNVIVRALAFDTEALDHVINWIGDNMDKIQEARMRQIERKIIRGM